MPARADNSVTYRRLYQSSLLAIADYSCHADNTDVSDEEESDKDRIVLMRRGAFSRHFGRKQVTSDVNQSVFFARGSTYRVSHPAACGDRGTMFVVKPSVLGEIIRELDPDVDEQQGKLFTFVTGPCDPQVFWRHRQFIAQLESSQPEPLWVDETALAIVGDVLASAFEHQETPRTPVRRETRSDHADRAEAAKTYLASRFAEPITLDEVARAVHSSPFNFARIFQRQTGLPIHRYLTRLRLRAALERLHDAPTDLTQLALDLGFSSHSHFTEVFRREFGHTPSEVKRARI
jgi:AraC family transcriptional regulator